MDPASLFAPGGIVQGLSNLGNSIGDSFKSYALIRKERDDADMARTKMIFDAQDKIQQQKLEQQRLDAQMKMWQGQQAADQQRIGLEGQRVELTRQGQAQDIAERERTRQFQTSSFAAEHGAYKGGVAGAPYDPTLGAISEQQAERQRVSDAFKGAKPTNMFRGPQNLMDAANPANQTPEGAAYEAWKKEEDRKDTQTRSLDDYRKEQIRVRELAEQATQRAKNTQVVQHYAASAVRESTPYNKQLSDAMAEKAKYMSMSTSEDPKIVALATGKVAEANLAIAALKKQIAGIYNKHRQLAQQEGAPARDAMDMISHPDEVADATPEIWKTPAGTAVDPRRPTASSSNVIPSGNPLTDNINRAEEIDDYERTKRVFGSAAASGFR